MFARVAVEQHSFQVGRLAGNAQPLIVLEGAEFLLCFGLVIEVPKKLAPLVGTNLVDGRRQVDKDTFDSLIIDLRRLDLLKDLYWPAQGCRSVFECLATFFSLLTSLRFKQRGLPVRVFLNLVGQEIISVNVYLLLRGLLRQAFRVVRNLQRRFLRSSHSHGAKILLKVKWASRWYSIISLFLNVLVNTILMRWCCKVRLRSRSTWLFISRIHFVLLNLFQS